MKSFIKKVLSNLFAFILAMGIFVFILVVVLIGFVTFFSDPAIEIKDMSILVLDLSTNITDSPSSIDSMGFIRESLQGNVPEGIYLKELIDTLEKAGTDKRIVGLFLTGNLQTENYASSYATLLEVRRVLREFSESGKWIVGYISHPTIRDYFLVSAADSVILNPFGTLSFKGLAAERFYLGDAFKKYGIGIQMVGAGRYKSYGESFSRNEMSPEDREQTQILADNIWNEIIKEVGISRKIEVDRLQKIADEVGVLSAQEALQYGMVDAVHYFDEVIESMIEKGSFDEDIGSFTQIDFRKYAESGKSALRDVLNVDRDKIAIVYAEGNIVSGSGSPFQVGGEKMARELRKLRRDKKVKAVVLRVNSPGGTAFGSELILREISLLASDLPVVVSMGGLAASGGYWISSMADTVFAEPFTITGSIGVYGMIPDIKKLANEYGLTFDGVKTADLAGLYSITRPKTEKEMKVFTEHTDFIYESFIDRVAKGRGLEREIVEKIAEGRVWSGADALKIGLVDRLGGLREALSRAAELASLDDYSVIQVPEKKDVLGMIEELLDSDFSYDRAESHSLEGVSHHFREELKLLQTFNDPNHIYARLPYVLKIN